MKRFYTFLASVALVLSANAAPFGKPVAAGTESLRTSVASIMKPGDTAEQVKASASSRMLAAPQRAQEQDGKLVVTKVNGVITEVSGVDSKFYERAATGTTFFVEDGSLYYANQSGMVEIKEDGNSVYIKDPLTRFTMGSWVKGTKDGNTISIPTWQPLYYDADFDACICLAWGNYANNFAVSEHSDVITFSVDGNTLTLEGTTSPLKGKGYLIGAYWNDDKTYQGYWDAETVLTYDDGYVPPTAELVELPAGASVEGWYLNSTEIVNQEVNVAFVGSDVYVQGISSDFPTSWIKGSISGSTITFEKLQYLGKYAETYDIWVVGADDNGMCDLTAAYDEAAKTITFNETVVINAASDRIYYLELIEDAVLSAEAADGPSTELVELPAGASVEGWYLNSSSLVNQDVNVAFVGSDVYVQGISSRFPTSWIKGSISGTTITFDKFQYLGVYGGTYDIWLIGVDDDDNICDLTAAYDAAAKTITFNESICINAASDRIYYLDMIEDAVLSAEAIAFEEPVLTEQVATLPYENTFETAAEREQVVFYDGNHDNKTFSFVDDNGNEAARISYNEKADADDYIAFPGFALKAGQKYTVSVNARCAAASYPEKFEVVCGTVAKASEYTISVIEPTTVANTSYNTFSTTDFMVDEDGVYFFAIHGISPADRYNMFIDDFAIYETPEMSVVLWDNSGMNYENPCVNYSTDGGATFEGPVAMIALSEPSLADEFENIETPTSSIYGAYVPAATTHVFFSDGDSAENRSKVFVFDEETLYTDSVDTGIELIDANTAKAEYFNLQGIRVANPVAGGIYIVRQANKTSKVLVK